MKDLKQRTIRGGFAKLCGQAIGFFQRLAYVAIMARLLDPRDFGLVAMVTAITGLYGIFVSAGLSTATIQRPSINDAQISTLFWINILVGVILAFLCLVTAPILVRFYNEPRLFGVTLIFALGFVVNAASVQHAALLERQLRFVSLQVIETLSGLVGSVVGIGLAAAGFGYWALVAGSVASPAVSLMCVWVRAQWVPGLPRSNVEIGSMLHFGGTLTLNNVLVYVAYNLDKVLLGRFWGPEVLGLYGRAYQLINIPTENLNSAIGGVAFSALSRLQNDPARFKSYFLKGYSLINSLTLPTTIFCALFADSIVLAVLGPKWIAATSVFRLLAPTVMIFGIINPLSWLLLSSGLYARSFRIALLIVPIVITAYLVGLPFGASGVALGFSGAMVALLIPVVLWCVHGTAVSPRDILTVISRPIFSAILAGAFAIGARYYLGDLASPWLSLALYGSIMVVIYASMLLFAMGQGPLYLDLVKGLIGSSQHANSLSGEIFDKRGV
jgi:PST family polysaccharide transporter